MKSMTKIAIAAVAVTALMPITVLAQNAKNQGYLTANPESAIVMTASGLCVHTSEWATAHSNVENCDGFVRPVAEAPKPAPAPRPVAAAPAPAPIIAQAPAPKPQPAPARPIPPKMSFSADALFAFDKSILKPEGKAMLDDLVRQLDGVNYDSIQTIGHTDRFGSDAYNQKLSERRANTVKEYLVSKNIPANRIVAEGKGESQPITKAGECTGNKSAKVIACLQPDRRVDVDMSGSKPVLGFR